MKPQRLVWQIFPASALTLLVAIVAVSWYGAASLQEFHLREKERDLEARAILVSYKVKEYLREDRIAELQEYAIRAGRSSGTRITVIAPSGKVIADSDEDPEVMDNHRYRPEIAQAFTGAVGGSRRYSHTLEENRVYTAIPLALADGQDTGGNPTVGAVLRTSVSVASMDQAMDRLRLRILFGCAAILLLAGAVTLFVSRNISRPLEQMTRTAGRFSRGDFSERMLPHVKRTASLEVVTLAGSMDRMAEILDEKIQAIVTQRNQLEAVFSSMVEAVIAIDPEERIISFNEAAGKIFGVSGQVVTGRIVQQVVRNVQLQQKIAHTLATREAVVDEIVIQDGSSERFLQTNVVPLSNGVGENVGVLVVMNDVTKLRRLETVRRDFVANVSHELRTPITSIRGYVETLLDEGMLDNREDAVRFLEIILRQSVRLSTIIDDLLALSRIEADSGQGAIALQPQQLLPVIEGAVQGCRQKADQAGVSVAVACPESIIVNMNPSLLEQAVVNLLVNAVTYSKKGDQVDILVTAEEHEKGQVRIAVRDAGCGIAKEHLPRLFERFYRSDKARSRRLGGTGLGLAIVRHIAEAHNGRVEVTSVVGEGSEFTLIVKGGQAT